jgi:hypothetical protein
MGILSDLLKPFKSAEKSIESQTLGRAKSKATRMQSMPKSKLNSTMGKATSSVNKEIRKATTPPKI